MIPIRCHSCGKPIAHLYEEFQERKKRGEDVKKILD
ncbi:DNA-directed RNA polymerase subunit N, partial [Candidatus Woesearchaeota archaeon]|nr:DNA-directed RNA polymerase subunit N [Candidatus Woesearchaeota archaeon]